MLIAEFDSFSSTMFTKPASTIEAQPLSMWSMTWQASAAWYQASQCVDRVWYTWLGLDDGTLSTVQYGSTEWALVAIIILAALQMARGLRLLIWDLVKWHRLLSHYKYGSKEMHARSLDDCREAACAQ